MTILESEFRCIVCDELKNNFDGGFIDIFFLDAYNAENGGRIGEMHKGKVCRKCNKQKAKKYIELDDKSVKQE